MEERTWRRGQKQTYTDRPLTDEEREFAADWENYKKLFEIMRYYNLNEEEWYDILIIPYLQAVKKYHVREDLRKNYKFFHVLNLMITKAVYNHNRAMNRQSRMPEGGFVEDYWHRIHVCLGVGIGARGVRGPSESVPGGNRV